MKNKVALYCIINNEYRLKEFILYYKNVVCINLFIILDDNSTIDYIKIFQECNLRVNIDYILYKVEDLNINLNYVEKVTFLHEFKSSFFIKNYLYKLLIDHNIDYVIQLDADEFLYFNGDNIDYVINKYYPFDSLRINWLFFGSNDHVNVIKTNDSTSIIKTFRYCDDKLNNLTKSITKVKSINVEALKRDISAHYIPIYDHCITKNILNDIVKNNEINIYIETNVDITNDVYLAHYINQDLNTFLCRKVIRLYEFQEKLSLNEIKNLIVFINDNMSDFIKYMYDRYFLKIIDENLLTSKFDKIPIFFTDYIISFFTFHNRNKLLNLNIINKYEKF